MHPHDTLRFVPRITSLTLGAIRTARGIRGRVMTVAVGQTVVVALARCNADGSLSDPMDAERFEHVAALDEAARLASPNVAPNREMQRAAAAFRARDNALRGATYQTGPRRGQQIAARR